MFSYRVTYYKVPFYTPIRNVLTVISKLLFQYDMKIFYTTNF